MRYASVVMVALLVLFVASSARLDEIQPANASGGHLDGNGFGMNCKASGAGRFDPIVYFGKRRAGHRHVFFGATHMSGNTTYHSLETHRSTCIFSDGSNGTNKSAYWAPDLLTRDGYAGIVGANVYYHNGTLNKQEVQKMQPFPRGLKLVADNVPEAQAVWSCTNGTGFLHNMTQRPTNCPGGGSVTFRMYFPQCGTGKADSPDHRSHVVYPEHGRCPASHPQVYPQIIPIVHYDTSQGQGARLASGDAWTTLHSDYFEAWNRAHLQRFIDKCNKAEINCKHQPGPG